MASMPLLGFGFCKAKPREDAPGRHPCRRLSPSQGGRIRPSVCAVRKGLYGIPYGRIPAYGGDRAIRFNSSALRRALARLKPRRFFSGPRQILALRRAALVHPHASRAEGRRGASGISASIPCAGHMAWSPHMIRSCDQAMWPSLYHTVLDMNDWKKENPPRRTQSNTRVCCHKSFLPPCFSVQLRGFFLGAVTAYQWF
jgi:hypothetical protein